MSNTQCRLAARPVGLPRPTDWTFTEEPVSSPAEGELLVRVEYLSIDPAMRTWMNAGRSYVPPVGIGEVMRAAGIGRVVESRHPQFAVGDEMYGVFGVQCYALSDGRGVTPVDTTLATHRVAGSNPVPATPATHRNGAGTDPGAVFAPRFRPSLIRKVAASRDHCFQRSLSTVAIWAAS